MKIRFKLWFLIAAIVGLVLYNLKEENEVAVVSNDAPISLVDTSTPKPQAFPKAIEDLNTDSAENHNRQKSVTSVEDVNRKDLESIYKEISILKNQVKILKDMADHRMQTWKKKIETRKDIVLTKASYKASIKEVREKKLKKERQELLLLKEKIN